MLAFALLALSLFAIANVDAPPTVAPAPTVELAPMPRPKKCEARGSAACLCPDGEMRCKARAALALSAVKPPTRAVNAPSNAEMEAAKKALQK